MMAGPWDKYRSRAAAPPGSFTIGQPDPYAQQIDKERLDKARADNAAEPYNKRKSAADAAKAEADARNADAIQKADSRIKTAQAEAIERANAEAAADASAAAMKPTGRMRIDDVPPAARPIVQSLLAGNLPVGARSVTSPQMLPYLQMAINVDPNFSAATFPARAAATKQLADMKSTGGYLTSLAANIDHSREEETAVNRLNNPGGAYGRWGGAALHNYFVNKGGPAGSQFDQANRVYSGEQVKSIVGNVGSAGGGSALADRQDAERAISADMPIDAQRAALRTGAIQNYQKFRDADQGFMRTIGTHIPNALSQEQAAQLLHLMRLQEDGTEGDIPDNVDPGFVALAQGGGSDRNNRPWNAPGGGNNTPGGGSGNGGPPPAGGDVNRTSTFIDNTPMDQRGTQSASSAQYVAQNDAKTAGIVDHWIRMGKSAAEINAQLNRLGLTGATVDPEQVRLAQEFLTTPAGRAYKGNLASATRQVEQSPMERAGNVMGLSTVGAGTIGAYGGLNSLTFGSLGAASDAITGMPGQSDLAISTAHQAHPWAAGAGEMVGTLPAFVGAEAGLAKLAARGIGSSPVAAALAGSPLTADAVGGAYVGAGSNPGDRIGGAITGGLAGVGGGFVGRNVVARALASAGRSAPVSAVSNALLRSRGLPEVTTPPKLSVAEALVANAANKAGVDSINAQLTQASRMGVPMALADTDQGLKTLAGSAVRRSPSAAQLAEDTLAPRSRGQIDRLGTAVERDLGPIGNVPQISADLAKKAKTDAGPLYDLSNAQPVPGTPEIASLLETPFGREGLSKARTIMANDRVSPTELGFSQDAEGSTILNPQPNRQIANHMAARAELDDAQNAYRMARNGTGDMEAARNRVQQARDGVRQAEQGLNTSNDPTLPANGQNYTMQALDYAKQGMDDVLEQHRNSFGKLELGPLGNSQNTVKNQLLAEVDKLNEHYAPARAAYGGPMQSRDAMALGQDAYSMNPNELAVGLQGKSDEQMAQIQLGHRDALMSNAEKLRYSTNPWEATLGNPAAEQRLNTLYPDQPSVAQLLAQRDMEATMAGTKNEVLGGSQTARRTLADRAFGLATGPSLAFDAGMLAMGHPPLATAALLATKGAKMGWDKMAEKGAIEKADAIAPMLLNTNPDASAAILRNLMDSSQAYQDYIRANNARLAGPLGVVGAGTGAATFAN